MKVAVLVDTSGAVTEARISKPGYEDTDRAALENAKRWRFEWSARESRSPATLTLLVPFQHPRSSDLVWPPLHQASASGFTTNAEGKRVQLDAALEASAYLDSVTGEYEYHYVLTNTGHGSTGLLYLALYPLELNICGRIEGTWSSSGWKGFQGCSGHIDVAGWMAWDYDTTKDPHRHELRPGQVIEDLKFTSFNAPGQDGRWLVDGGAGCGPACRPWADSCSGNAVLTGLTCVPSRGALVFRTTITGTVGDSALTPIPWTRVEVLGAGVSCEASRGEFRIENVPFGRFRVRASAPGYVAEEQWIDTLWGGFLHPFKLRKLTGAKQ